MSDVTSDFFQHEKNLNHKIMDSFIHMSKNHRSVLEKRLQETGVYRGQHHLLMCIARNPELSQRELAELQNVSTAAIAVSLKKLEKGGYVARAVDEKDSRSNIIKITEKGLKVVQQSIHIFEETDTILFAGFTEEEKQQFLGFINRAGENIKRYGYESSESCLRSFKKESEDKENEAI